MELGEMLETSAAGLMEISNYEFVDNGKLKVETDFFGTFFRQPVFVEATAYKKCLIFSHPILGFVIIWISIKPSCIAEVAYATLLLYLTSYVWA